MVEQKPYKNRSCQMKANLSLLPKILMNQYEEILGKKPYIDSDGFKLSRMRTNPANLGSSPASVLHIAVNPKNL